MPEPRQPGLQSLIGLAKFVAPWVTAILVGAILLRTDSATQTDQLGWIDALFTATSAICVTGLTTVDIGQRLSPFGEGVVLTLIQLGGLGISTISTFLLVTAGRAKFSTYFATQSSLSAVRVKPLRLLLFVFVVTAVVETAGVFILHDLWNGSQSWWSATFHSISAFCNAGFSLFDDSLTAYQSNTAINLTFCALIVLGGIGFIALYQMGIWLIGKTLRRPVRLYLHTRVVLVGSIALWVLGTVMFLVFERDMSLQGLSAGERALASFFQSVTTRTAGFNTIDFSAMREPTLFFTMFLMLIGGAPGGCAGGIKVTTTVVILYAVFARVRGRESVTMFRRTVPPELVRRSYTLLLLSLIFLTITVSVLLLTEERRAVSDVRSDRFMLLAFEAVSAYGTVGLSAGVTAGLSVAGKLMIIACMIVGRLGPLAVALAVFKPRPAPPFEYPSEELAIG